MNYSAKVIASLAVLIIVIIGIGVVGHNILGTSSGDLENRISKIEESMSSDDWKTAEQRTLDIQDKWRGVKGTWAILIDHQEIDNIDVTLARMQTFIRLKDTTSAKAEASVLKKFVKHIPVKEALSIENVL